ncbi:7TMR-DISMED2 domain-containing protein [Pedobacter sp. NJ-S-72]
MTKPVFTSMIGYLVRILMVLCLSLLLTINLTFAQKVVFVNDKVPHHIFSYREIEYLEDKTNVLTLFDILKPSVNSKFLVNTKYTKKKTIVQILPTGISLRSSMPKHPGKTGFWSFLISLSIISLFVPDSNSNYHAYHSGTAYPFNKREYQHKNFIYELSNDSNAELTYYVRIKSSQSVSAIIVLRDIRWFIKYALNEYLIFGLFYGMVIVFF